MSFNPIELWGKMTIVAQGVVVLLIIMSIYSLTIAFERFLYYRKARNQSVAYAKMVTGFLKQDKLQDAIDASKKFKNSHVARVLSAGLYEFSHDIKSGGATVKGHDMIEAAERAIEREALVTTADMKKGLSGLATIGTTAPFIGLFGTVIGVIGAFRELGHGAASQVAAAGPTGQLASQAVMTSIAEALVATAVGIFVALPAVAAFNYFQRRIASLLLGTDALANLVIAYVAGGRIPEDLERGASR